MKAFFKQKEWNEKVWNGPFFGNQQVSRADDIPRAGPSTRVTETSDWWAVPASTAFSASVLRIQKGREEWKCGGDEDGGLDCDFLGSKGKRSSGCASWCSTGWGVWWLAHYLKPGPWREYSRPLHPKLLPSPQCHSPAQGLGGGLILWLYFRIRRASAKVGKEQERS